MNFLNLFRRNKKILLFGVLLTFFSSFGQTFVLSLYIPNFLEDFDISRSFYSGLYAMATILSATTLIYAGRWIDHIPLKRFSFFVFAGIFFACILAGVSQNVIMLFFSIYLLRLFGQGLLSHTSTTTVSRYFSRARGKALSIAFLGFPLGEAVFPVAIVSMIMWIGWRETFLSSAGLIMLVLIPLAIFMMNGFLNSPVYEGNSGNKVLPEVNTANDRMWKQREILRSKPFFILAPTVFLVGFMLTALFFFQVFIAEYKGWAVEWMAASIVAYAASSFLASITSGPLIDKFSARRIFPLTLIPLALGLLVLNLFSHQAATPVFWMLVGVTAGMNSPLSSALYAEIYGTRSLGTVRSLFTFVMVISTALGPVVYSFFLERGITFTGIHFGLIAVIIVNVIFVAFASRYLS